MMNKRQNGVAVLDFDYRNKMLNTHLTISSTENGKTK